MYERIRLPSKREQVGRVFAGVQPFADVLAKIQTNVFKQCFAHSTGSNAMSPGMLPTVSPFASLIPTSCLVLSCPVL